jgi:hypothetical protein
MAEYKIKDGTGTGELAKVNGDNRLYTQAVTITENDDANKKGLAYNINTGIITLTSAADTPIMYLKNNDDTTLHITAIAVGVGPSTGGSGGIPKITVIRNPTAGTTISNANDVDIKSNRNYGSQNTLSDVVAYKGATGETITDGEDHLILFQTSNGRLFAQIDEILEKGSSIGVKFDPQTGNTSQDVYCALICHQEVLK